MTARGSHDPRTRPFRTRAGRGHRRCSGGAAAARRPCARHPPDADRAATRDRPAHRAGDRLRLPDLERRGGRLLGRQRGGELQQPDAAGLQDHRHLGEPRGLHPALVPDPRAVRRRGRGLRSCAAIVAARPRDRGTRLHLGRLPAVRAHHLQPAGTRLAAADRRPRHEPAAAGPGPRRASAGALRRLCRLRDPVRLRRRRTAGRSRRCRLGPLGTALDPGRMVPADRRHRARLLVGVLRTRLGRLLVLGPGGERLAAAVALRHRAAAFRHRGGEARGAEDLDHPAGDRHVLADRCAARSWCAPAS